MKLATYERNGQVGIGIVAEKQIHAIQDPGMPTSMLEFIQGGNELWKKVNFNFQRRDFKTYLLPEVHLLAPINNPPKIMAIGHNYMDHIREQTNVPVPTQPMLFAKYPTSIIGPDETISWDEQLTQQVDLEGELGVVIGQKTRRVTEDMALESVFGYTILNDVSARDVQYGDKQWTRGKSLDTFCPMGPVIVTKDEIPDPQALHLSSRINDFVMQDSSTKEMIFSVRYLISFLSQSFTLEAGDLIATGTPKGVGMYRSPQIFLKDGDIVTIEVEKIGTITNPIKILKNEG